MTQYGTIYSGGASRLVDEAPIVDGGSAKTRKNKNKSGCATKMSAKKFQKLIARKPRRHAADESDERSRLCVAVTADDDDGDDQVLLVSEARLQEKHRKMRGLWKGFVEAVVQQFYFMTVSIENSGGIYRATTVTKSDGTIATELHYYPASPYVTCSS